MNNYKHPNQSEESFRAYMAGTSTKPAGKPKHKHNWQAVPKIVKQGHIVNGAISSTYVMDSYHLFIYCTKCSKTLKKTFKKEVNI